MVDILFLLLILFGGMLSALQVPINGLLGSKVGTLEASFISFTIGTLILLLAVIFFGKGELLKAVEVPKWQLAGGLLGAAFVTFMIIVVPHIGVASAIFATIIGQMAVSMIIDHFGFFGMPRIPFNWSRFFGLIFMVTSLYLIFRHPESS